jgi:hypothetical protein
MAPPKGSPKPPGSGRQRGTPNKTTAKSRALFAHAFEALSGDFERWVRQLAKEDLRAACEAILALAEYHVPKLGRLEHTGEGGGPVVVRLISLPEDSD